MKNLLHLSLLAFSIFLIAGCQLSDDDDLVTPDPVVLPDLAVDFIQTNYPDFQVQDQDYEDLCDNTEVLEVELEDGPEPDLDLYFSLAGEFLFSATEIMLDELPEAVRNTIDSAYASYIIDAESVERFDFPDGSVQYAVELIDVNSEEDYELVLAQDGTVVCWEEDYDDDDGNDDGSDTLTISIPDTVSSFISSTYEGYQIDGVENEDLCDDEDFFKVELEDGPGVDIDLYFNLDWVFQFSATDISDDQVPTIVSDAIAVDYPDFQVVPGEAERLDYPNGDVAYLLEIESPNGDDRDVLYGADGTLQCDDNDDDDGGNGNGNDDTSLPDSTHAYINSEYPGYQIDNVEKEDLCDDEDYFKVELEDGPGADIDLYFSLSWQLSFTATEITASALPAAVTNALAVDYPGAQIESDSIERLDFPDGSVQYYLEVETSDEDYDLVYTSAGGLVCSQW